MIRRYKANRWMTNINIINNVTSFIDHIFGMMVAHTLRCRWGTLLRRCLRPGGFHGWLAGRMDFWLVPGQAGEQTRARSQRSNETGGALWAAREFPTGNASEPSAVLKLSRTAGAINHFNKMQQRKTGKWAGCLLPEELDKDASSSNAILLALTPRVRDERIREMVKTFRNHACNVGISWSEQAEQEAMDKMFEVVPPLHERIGEVLRKLDDDEDALER
jgi:hypothetical protein